MGLTNSSVGLKTIDAGLTIQKQAPGDKVVALAGNPNVGKSTVFNALTGLNQHTGNWPGKTVASAQGRCATRENAYILVDIPGTYSLMAHSAEEEVARNFICFGGADAVVVVCDATCLARNLNLVLQTLEITPNVVVCVNLMDEAARKGIRLDLELLSARLGVPVVGAAARRKKTLAGLLGALDRVCGDPGGRGRAPLAVRYPQAVENAVALLQPAVEKRCGGGLSSRWLSLKLLEGDPTLGGELRARLGRDPLQDPEVSAALVKARAELAAQGIGGDRFKDLVVAALVKAADGVCQGAVLTRGQPYAALDRRLDRLLTSRLTGYPVMLLLLAGIFWLTITGANYPSQLLAQGLFWVQDRLTELFLYLHAPAWLHGALVLGVYRVLAWVVSVMLPPAPKSLQRLIIRARSPFLNKRWILRSSTGFPFWTSAPLSWMDSSVCALDEPVAPPQPSRPVLPPTRRMTSPGCGRSRTTFSLGAAAITAPTSMRLARKPGS